MTRTWRVGDRVDVALPCAVRLSKLDDKRSAYQAMYSFVYGDTLLVGIAPSAGASHALPIPAGVAPEEWVKTAVKRRDGDALRFVVKPLGATGSAASAAIISLMPLNEVVEERYTVYYNLTARS